MVEETFDDDERRLLLDLAILSLPLHKGDPLTIRVIAKLAGADTRLVARRVYASAGTRWQETSLSPAEEAAEPASLAEDIRG